MKKRLKAQTWPLQFILNKEEAYLVKVDALFNLGAEEELTAILEEIESINPHTPLKPLLNSLRLERGKAQYP